MTGRSRRSFLAGAATGVTGLLAGCVLVPDDGDSGERTVARSNAGTTAGSDAMPTVTATGTAIAGRMVPIEGGTYTIGSDEGPEDARPAHAVTIAPFAIDRTEVTNDEFAAFLNDLDVEPTGEAAPGGATRSDFPEGRADLFVEGPEGEEKRPLIALDDGNARIGITDGDFVVENGYADHPVVEVTWRGARRFARSRVARLPTEAEWEAAARGFEGRTYPWGEEPPTDERAVFGRSSGDTAPVGSHPAGATPEGVQDMAGNVSEWTSSLYRPYPYDADDGREDPTVRGERVTRGGAHVFFGPEELRAYYRSGFSREFDRGHRHIGFRCAKSLE